MDSKQVAVICMDTVSPLTTVQDPKGKKRILVVEDDLVLGSMYSTKLLKEGFDVNWAKDGESGFEEAKKWVPHLVLLDLILPKRDGLWVLEQLKKNPSTYLVPVIVWTNISREEEEKKARELGAADYLLKVSFLPADVVKKVRERLGEE